MAMSSPSEDMVFAWIIQFNLSITYSNAFLNGDLISIKSKRVSFAAHSFHASKYVEVEMAGIEPASESFCHQTSTSLVSHFSFHVSVIQETGFAERYPLEPESSA